MKRKLSSIQIKAFFLLMIFVINITALCSCGFAQLPSHHKKMMMKDCCCCKHDSPKKACNDNHTANFGQLDKILSQAFVLNHFFTVAFISNYFSSSIKTVTKNITVYKTSSFIDTSPPDLRILYRSFLI